MIKGRRGRSAVGGALAVLMLLTAAGCGGSSPALPSDRWPIWVPASR